jgi:hypothetical protein
VRPRLCLKVDTGHGWCPVSVSPILGMTPRGFRPKMDGHQCRSSLLHERFLPLDDFHFDALARSLTEARSRRGLTRLLSGLTLGGPLALLGLAETEAKRKKKKKKKKGATPVAPPPPPPPPPPTCTIDGVKNGTETDIDCGGGTCPPCGTDKTCQAARDCVSGVCLNQVCQAPSCTDGFKNGSETDRDCGGSCPKCVTGKACQIGADCVSGSCLSQVCQPTCWERPCATDTQCTSVGCGTCKLSGWCGL